MGSQDCARLYLIYLLTARDTLSLVAGLPQLDVGEGLGQLALHLLEIRCFLLAPSGAHIAIPTYY